MRAAFYYFTFICLYLFLLATTGAKQRSLSFGPRAQPMCLPRLCLSNQWRGCSINAALQG